jgi:hypothetical protein
MLNFSGRGYRAGGETGPHGRALALLGVLARPGGRRAGRSVRVRGARSGRIYDRPTDRPTDRLAFCRGVGQPRRRGEVG